MQEKRKQPQAQANDVFPFLNYLPSVLFGVTLFLAPLFPDEKLNRLKLVVLGAGLILCAVTWAVQKIFSERWQFYRTPLDGFLLLYLLFSSLFYFFSKNQSAAFSEFQRTIFSVGAFFVGAQVCSGFQSEKAKCMAINGWMGGLLLASIYGILQRFGGWGQILVPKMDRVFSTFGNPIFFAAFLIISIPIALACFIQSKNLFARSLYFLTFILSCWALFHTQTRAAFLAVIISLFLFFLLSEQSQGWVWSKKIIQKKIRIAVFFIAVFSMHLLGQRFSPAYSGFSNKLQNIFSSSRISDFRQTHTMIWKDVVQMWRKNAWLGTGYGTFHVEFPQYASEELKKAWPQKLKMVNDAHNEYLQTLAETGLIGFAVFISMIAAFYWISFRKINQEQDWMGRGLLCGVTALLIQNFFSVDMRFIVSSAYLFLCMGLLCASWGTPVQIQWPKGAFGKAVKLGWVSLFLVAGPWMVFSTMRPYLSQKFLEKAPDFFDEKLLNSSQTLHDLENLVAQYPEVAKYWEKLGYALAKGMQKTDPAGKKIINLAIAQKAVTAFEKAYTLNPSNPGPPNNIGNIFFTLNRRAEAIEWWKKVITSNPETVDARVNLGLAYYYEGKIKESAEQFQEVLKRDPNNERAIVMLRHMVE